MVSSPKQDSTDTRRLKFNPMHPFRSPRTKAGLKYQQKQQKVHIHMEAEQHSTQ